MHHSRLTGFPACSTKSEFSCGVGVPPAHERLIENGARSQFKEILEWPRSSCHTDSCDVSPSPVRSTHFTRD
ncbi:MAG: hypothetical protein EAZ25_09745 [Oscillatoriales cyanobacterium]|nr:MAG: hypothetical protein EAZ94_09055 [Oscillatoriales cyanobacterium]TAE71554.1 MAG: hypothetical protein EAZ86_03245 [Oscillatoriales cyanobacterium]TAG42642.1 MAG: hypothetical protein EAZ33_14705 [Oscillatoriales cyanobacterium]TAG59462.1 MAG: hypothetical protein EAZ28_11255 [Oscillatoriales cyanobacterium]TAG66928.1 MAG: hypothetical protein EAZ25_09745 [Oscillatoriales cyanobacterium]